MENVNIHVDSERISCSIYSGVARRRQTVDQRIIDDCTNTHEFFESLPEAELLESKYSPLKAAANASEFKTASDKS